jgi:hypothetical protein
MLMVGGYYWVKYARLIDQGCLANSAPSPASSVDPSICTPESTGRPRSWCCA